MSDDGINDRSKTKGQLLKEIALLRSRLQETEEALDEIRSGEVDALVVNSDAGDQIFTLPGAEHPYRVMVESMSEGAATLLEDGSILYANPRLASILCEPIEALIGSSILDFIVPEDRKIFEGLVEQAFSKSSKTEIHFQCRDQSTVPVLVSFSPTEVEGAQALCLVATDLTEQKRSEEIVAAERLARSILDQAAEAILVCDSGGIIVRANQKALNTFPRNPIYKFFDEALPLTYKQPQGRTISIANVLKGESFQEIEAEYRFEREESRFFLLSGAPLLKDQDQTMGCVIILTEITERKRTEELIRSYSARLERSNKELQDFAFIASHDLQEPLRKIEAFGNLIGYRSQLEETDRDYLDRMQTAARRMRIMIDDLLNLSRIATHTRPYQRVDLNEVAKRAVDDLEARINQTKGQVILHPLPIIVADDVQMHQLIQNLVGNAVKYHRPDTPPLVEIGCRPASPGWIELYVQDNGIGFDLKYLDQIFQPFRRLHGIGEYEGSGMGLAICQKIVERHGGQITAHSVLGEGATFSVTLPVKQV